MDSMTAEDSEAVGRLTVRFPQADTTDLIAIVEYMHQDWYRQQKPWQSMTQQERLQKAGYAQTLAEVSEVA